MMYDAQGMGAIASADPQKYFEAEWSEMVVVGYDKPMPEYDLPVDVIVLVIIVIVLGVLLFMSIKILNIKGRVNSRDEFEKEKVKGLKKVKSASRFSNREKVRKIYRQFLDIMVGRGVKVTENMT